MVQGIEIEGNGYAQARVVFDSFSSRKLKKHGARPPNEG
jgi:hypothetical protein